MDGMGAHDPVEIELTGVDSTTSAAHRSPPSERPGRARRQVLVAGALAAAVVTLAAPVVVRVLDDDTAERDASPPETSTVPPPSNVEVTAPPTLAPLGTALLRPPEALRPADYPVVERRPPAAGSFDLTAAVADLTADRPRRVLTEYFGGTGAATRDTREATRDVVNDRFELVITINSIAHSFVTDFDIGVTYQSINAQDASWFGMRNEDMESGMDRDLRSLVDVSLTGPLDPAWLATEAVEDGPIVELPDGTVTRRFSLVVDAAVAGERYRDRTEPDPPPDVPIELRVYVTGDNRLALVEGAIHTGREWRLVVHRVEELSADEAVVELPDPSLVSGGAPGDD